MYRGLPDSPRLPDGMITCCTVQPTTSLEVGKPVATLSHMVGMREDDAVWVEAVCALVRQGVQMSCQR